MTPTDRIAAARAEMDRLSAEVSTAATTRTNAQCWILRVIARDRATLDRHRVRQADGDCSGCGDHWPCPDAKPILDEYAPEAGQ